MRTTDVQPVYPALAMVAALSFGGPPLARAAPPELPDGAGKAVAAARCLGCHDASRLEMPGHTSAGWRNVIAQMQNIGVVLGPGDAAQLEGYLARSFPERPMPAATLVPGEARVGFREWAVATPGAFPHDPLGTADGALWYTGQHASVLGRVDPNTGQVREFPTAIPDSGPHGLVADVAGNIWFTANSAGYIGKLDPRTGSITPYPLGDAHDPHTAVFDQRGVLWFTVQGANCVGRLVPATGEVRTVAVPTPHALPYGIIVSSAGVPFFAEFGSNRIGSIDPESLAIREFQLPNSGSRPRRIAITSDDVLWYSDYARGMLGRYDPRTGASREWPSPGGASSQPYAIAALNDVIWYCETNVHPNTLVRFDPRTEKFQSWAIPSGGNVVRHMTTTRDGGLALAESGAGKVALVDVR